MRWGEERPVVAAGLVALDEALLAYPRLRSWCAACASELLTL